MRPTNRRATRALVVDDDPAIVEFVSAVLKSLGWEVKGAGTGDEALAEAHQFSPDVIFLDVNIPEQSGWLVCAKLKLSGHSPAVVVMTGLTGREVSQHAEFIGADGLLHKPFAAKEVLRITDQLSMRPSSSAAGC